MPSFHNIISARPLSQNFKYTPGHFFKEMQYVKMFLKRKFETLQDCETPFSKFKTKTQKNSSLQDTKSLENETSKLITIIAFQILILSQNFPRPTFLEESFF